MENPSVFMSSAEPPDTAGGPGPLQGTRILVIEDEFLIATVIEDFLRQAGAEEVVIAVNMQEAREALADSTLP
jgi:CheY-like chemotaxis protein